MGDDDVAEREQGGKATHTGSDQTPSQPPSPYRSGRMLQRGVGGLLSPASANVIVALRDADRESRRGEVSE